jgi:glutathione S-transferase
MTSQHSNAAQREQLAILTTFRRVPPLAVGHVRELRVRWALEEAGRPYQVRLIGSEDQQSPAYRQLQPFGQIPVYEENGLTLFESGAILLQIAERSTALMPTDEAGRASTKAWMFAALNTIEPHVLNLDDLDFFSAGEEWAAQRRPALEARVSKRLAELDNWLKDREYLAGQFTAADILMTTVLRALQHTDLVAQHPALHAYHRRCSARPAFAKALADHMALYDPSGQ